MFKKRDLASLVILATIPPMSAFSAQLEEIIVTSERRVENLQDIPVAVTALNENLIESADIHDLTDIATRVPGLTFSPFSPGQNILSLRGASSNDDGAGTDNSIALFLDDVYLGRVSNINPEMFDIERIEVLRGPQGTLYGKNTIGGAINVFSTRPNTEELEGKIRVNIGNYARRDVQALITGPLSDEWAGKVSLSSRKRDGWVDNRALNKDQKEDDAQAIRGQLLFSGQKFEALFSADYDQLDVGDMARIPIATGHPDDPARWASGNYLNLCPDRSPDCAAGLVDGYAKRKAWGVSARLSWDIGDSSELISITAYRGSDADWNMDATGTDTLSLNDDIKDETRQFSQKFRWLSNYGEESVMLPDFGFYKKKPTVLNALTSH